MSYTSEPQTGTALLDLLHDPANPQSWREFVECYRPRIYAWCRHWRLQDADAQNVTQEVLTKLVSKLRGFDYDPSCGRFRGWLKTVTSHACRDYLDKQRHPGRRGSGDPAVMDLLAGLEARQGLSSTLDQEEARELLQQAQLRVRQCISERDWNIFQALAIEGRSGVEVAEEHGMKVAAVFMVRSRVQQKLRREAQRLEGIDSTYGEGRS
jgi:RNA polymerase sigma factor (sigma-70 family)